MRNRKIPYGYNSYLNEMKKIRSLLSNRTNERPPVSNLYPTPYKGALARLTPKGALVDK
jgi:hypothetical protein